MRLTASVMTAVLVATLACFAHAEQADDPACKDHPMFTRMQGYWIHGCSVKEFDAHAFAIGNGKTGQVEGKTSFYRYYPQASLAS
jgi:hypothetical protein